MGACPEVTMQPVFITMLSTRSSVPIKTERLFLKKKKKKEQKDLLSSNKESGILESRKGS